MVVRMVKHLVRAVHEILTFIHIFSTSPTYVPYNRNIRLMENLMNRLNLPIGENLNWWQSMVGSYDDMDGTMDTNERVHKTNSAP